MVCLWPTAVAILVVTFLIILVAAAGMQKCDTSVYLSLSLNISLPIYLSLHLFLFPLLVLHFQYTLCGLYVFGVYSNTPPRLHWVSGGGKRAKRATLVGVLILRARA